MHNLRVVFTFPVYTRNAFFGVTMVQKYLNCYLQLNTWFLNQFEYVEFNGHDYFFHFRLTMPFWGTVGPKNLNCHVSLK